MAKTPDTASASPAKQVREVGPKHVYVHVANADAKSTVLGVHTNPRSLLDAVEANPGSSYTKLMLPQGEKRERKAKPAA